MKNYYKNRGFTLVELIVSVGITAVLMVGMATFFSSTFRNMFAAREKVTNSQGQFVVNTILGGKFVNADRLQFGDPFNEYAVIRNDMATGDLPFTYIGKGRIGREDHIVFKDFFVFNGRENNWKSATAPLDNPAGVTVIPPSAYVAVPLEDKIYKCDEMLSQCPAIEVLDMSDLDEPLDHPMDITSDGLDTIYITDAGNNRIVKVTNLVARTPTAEVLVTDTTFNYPTGIDFYSYGGPDYLFVADTYNHLVKKITLPGGHAEVVVGAGDDTDCDPDLDGRDHTAYFCKLNFPTGVMATNLMGYETLYIADTGNGRVLHVWDPYWDPIPPQRGTPDLSNLELKTTLPGPVASQVGHIDFVFPDSIILDPVPILEAPGSNSLHPGLYENDVNIVRYSLTSSILSTNIETVEECVTAPDPLDPDICTDHYYFRGFDTNFGENIFVGGDSIEIGSGNFYTVDSSEGDSVLVVDNTDEVDYAPGTAVKVVSTFGAGDFSFYLNLFSSVFDPGFNLITAEVYDPSGTLLNNPNDPLNFQTIRIGDGEIGTPEDLIEVVDDSPSFPTGIGSTDGIMNFSSDPQYSLDFPNYDYISDFEVLDDLSCDFSFSELNTGAVLEMEFCARLGENAEGNPILEENTLNANIKE